MIREKGFTLIEILVASTVAVLIGGLLMSIMINNTNLFYKQSSTVQQGLNANDALSKLRNSIKEAQSVVSSYPTSSSPIYTSGASELVLKLVAIDESGNIIPDVYDYVVYVTSNNKFYIKVFPDQQSFRQASDQILAGNVEEVKFSYFDETGTEAIPTAAVKIVTTLQLKQRSGADYQTSIATSEARLRNN